MSQYQNDPIIQLPNLYINGLVPYVDTIDTKKIYITEGIARDSQNVMDITLGSPNVQNQTTLAPLVISSAVLGAGGVDVLPMVANQIYSIYAIADSRYYKPVSAIISLDSVTPALPFGYDSYRKIGYVQTATSTDFYSFYVSGKSNERFFMMNAPIQVLTGGTATASTIIDLTNVVPYVDNSLVYVSCFFNAVAASDDFQLQFLQVNNTQFSFVAPVPGATSICSAYANVINQIITGVGMGISYQVSDGSLDVFVNGFNYTV